MRAALLLVATMSVCCLTKNDSAASASGAHDTARLTPDPTPPSATKLRHLTVRAASSRDVRIVQCTHSLTPHCPSSCLRLAALRVALPQKGGKDSI